MPFPSQHNPALGSRRHASLNATPLCECKFVQEFRLPDFTLIPSCIVILDVRNEAVPDADRLHIDAADMEHIGRTEGDRSTHNRFEPTAEFALALMARCQE
jgi:hypothetical protein